MLVSAGMTQYVIKDENGLTNYHFTNLTGGKLKSPSSFYSNQLYIVFSSPSGIGCNFVMFLKPL